MSPIAVALLILSHLPHKKLKNILFKACLTLSGAIKNVQGREL
jgi:hypothetical protein